MYIECTVSDGFVNFTREILSVIGSKFITKKVAAAAAAASVHLTYHCCDPGITGAQLASNRGGFNLRLSPNIGVTSK